MLILTRKSDESVIIGNDIIVKVLKVQGSQVQLGITAPREIAVYRHEIYVQVMAENKKAVQTSVGKGRIEELEKSLSTFKSLMESKGKNWVKGAAK